MPSGGNKKSPGGAKAKQSKTSLDKAANKDAGAAGGQDARTDEDTNSGFAEYLRSTQGAEMLKLFVVANSIVMFLTVAWPQMKQSYELLMSLIYGDGEEDL